MMPQTHLLYLQPSFFSRAGGLVPLSLLVTDIKTQMVHGFSFRSEQFIALAINTASL